MKPYKTQIISGILFGGFLLLLIFNPIPENPLAGQMLAVAVLMAALWITEVIPIAITSILPVILFPLMGIMDGKETCTQYFNDIIFLFIGGFILSLAMEKWNLHIRIALKTLRFFGSKPLSILTGFMLASSFLSMWMSNTATTMLMLPIALSVLAELKEIYGKANISKFNVALLLGIAYSCSIGGVATVIGTPPNLTFIAIFGEIYPNAPEITFAQWLFFAFPLYVVLLICAIGILYSLKGIKGDQKTLGKDYFDKEMAKLGKISYEQIMVSILFTLFAVSLIFKNNIIIGNVTIPGWSSVFEHSKYIKDGNVAMIIALLMFLIPSKNNPRRQLMDWETAVKLPWAIILLFGGGFALAKGVVSSGLTLWIGNELAGLSTASPVTIVGVGSLLMAFLTEFTSNTASTQIMLPIVSSLAERLLLNPLFLMIPVTLAASFAFMLPIATPPNAIVFGSGMLRMRDMLLPGFILNLVGVVVVTAATYYWATIVFGIEIYGLPEWAVGFPDQSPG